MNDVFTLKGKKILITGASKGIGRSIAVICSKNGAEVHITARNSEGLENTMNVMHTNGHDLHTADLGISEEVNALAKDLPILDALVLNAGIVKTMPVRFIKEEGIDVTFDVNIKGSILLIKQLLKLKKIRENGSICFISSVASKKMTVGNAIYSASKGAINSFTKSLALELAPKGIRVNAVLPGMVKTNILQDSSISQDDLKNHLNKYPIGRFGKPEDISYLVVYLLSNASTWMTGSLLTIDGGYSIS